MPEHRRRRATRRSATTPIGPKGCGGMAPSSSLPLLGDGGTSQSSQRLESGPMTHATDDAGGPGRASRGRGGVLDGTLSSPVRENPVDCGISQAAVATWWVARALLLRTLVSGRRVDAVSRLVGLEIIIFHLERVGPRDRHHAIFLGEPNHSHTLGRTTKT